MKAIVLISGGLDSVLAAKLMQQQGLEVIPLNFKIPFCNFCRQVNTAAKNLGRELKIINITEDFLEIFKNPKYGFGKNLNPCIDCKILMLRKAKELMPKWEAQFVVTGEVLGQRPMSQHKQALQLIERRAGLEGLVLRPLSAKLLPETIVEKEGWVAPEKLLSFSGRGRKSQIELAKNLGIKEYAQPAGGCLLTDPQFSKRLKDLIAHQELNIDNIELLKVGRHFRISENTKLAVGRCEKENKQLENLAKENDYLFIPQDTAGPTALGRGNFSDELIKLSCCITCRYCDRNGKAEIEIVYFKKGTVPCGDSPLYVKVLPLEEVKIQSLRI